MSSPIFLAFRPKGPNLGANVDAGPPSPPNTLILIYLIDYQSLVESLKNLFPCKAM